jgi:hypothetical protein
MYVAQFIPLLMAPKRGSKALDGASDSMASIKKHFPSKRQMVGRRRQTQPGVPLNVRREIKEGIIAACGGDEKAMYAHMCKHVHVPSQMVMHPNAALFYHITRPTAEATIFTALSSLHEASSAEKRRRDLPQLLADWMEQALKLGWNVLYVKAKQLLRNCLNPRCNNQGSNGASVGDASRVYDSFLVDKKSDIAKLTSESMILAVFSGDRGVFDMKILDIIRLMVHRDNVAGMRVVIARMSSKDGKRRPFFDAFAKLHVPRSYGGEDEKPQDEQGADIIDRTDNVSRTERSQVVARLLLETAIASKHASKDMLSLLIGAGCADVALDYWQVKNIDNVGILDLLYENELIQPKEWLKHPGAFKEWSPAKMWFLLHWAEKRSKSHVANVSSAVECLAIEQLTKFLDVLVTTYADDFVPKFVDPIYKALIGHPQMPARLNVLVNRYGMHPNQTMPGEGVTDFKCYDLMGQPEAVNRVALLREMLVHGMARRYVSVGDAVRVFGRVSTKEALQLIVAVRNGDVNKDDLEQLFVHMQAYRGDYDTDLLTKLAALCGNQESFHRLSLKHGIKFRLEVSAQTLYVAWEHFFV